MQEMYEDPSKIMSPERVLGMTSSPLDLLLMGSGAGLLSRFRNAGKAARTGSQVGRQVTQQAPQPSIANAFPENPGFTQLDSRISGMPPARSTARGARGPVSLEDAKYELIMRRIHGSDWKPRVGDVEIPKELLEKHKITYPPPPRQKP
jgi:hypothetical protein